MPPPHAPEVDEERKVAGSPHVVAANAAVLALTRSARSFTLYDPANKVVRTLIADYRDKLEKALAFGPLPLDVHPFELVLGKDVVYLEKDRERSLAFRLFRDGVRRLTFEPGATWDELQGLLQILSIRYTGVRQQEDDLVTLLRKAAFPHIKVSAIEGFLPEEESAESPLPGARRAGGRHEPPAQWDLPLPAFQESVPLRYRPVPDELLERLRAEESEAALPRAAVRAVAELLHTPGERDLPAALALGLDVREFLVLEGQFDLVLQLALVVSRELAGDPSARERFLDAYLDARLLAALVGAGPEPEAAGAPLLELLDAAPPPVLERLLSLFAAEQDPRRAAGLRQLVVRGFAKAPQLLAPRLHGAQGPIASALFQILSEIDPGAALHKAVEAAASPDPGLQTEALRLLASAPFGTETGRALARLTDAATEDLRSGAYAALARGGARSFPSLRAAAEKHASSLGAAEADALGKALVTASARSALELFSGWLKPKAGGLLSRLSGLQAPAALQRVALGGLATVAGQEVEALLEQLTRHGDRALAPAAEAVLRSRRSRGPRG